MASVEQRELWARQPPPPEFLPRDAYAQRGLSCRTMSVRPSVCHTPVLCPNGRTYRQKFS